MWDRFGAFVMAGPSRKTQNAASEANKEQKYCNKDGVCLSCVDCLMLRLAVENPNVDVLTQDATLIRAICAECGFLGRPRTRRALSNYHNRQFDISNMIHWLARGNPFVNIQDVLWDTKYEFDSWKVIISDTLTPSVKMERIGKDTHAPCPFEDERGVLDAILACWNAEYGDYCRSHHSDEFMDMCTCGKYPYDKNTDSGLDEPEARMFLYTQPVKRRNEIVRLARSFESFYYGLNGPSKPMVWPNWGEQDKTKSG